MDCTTSLERRGSSSLAPNERGAALLLALFVLTTLTIVALYLGSQAQINRRISGDDMVKTRALRCAEAGVAEALARIQSGLGPDPYGANPALKVVQVLNTSVGAVVGADTTLLPTGQPAGARLPYTTEGRGSKALTIEFRTNAARTQIFKYNKALTPPIQTSSGMPIFRITSTGRVGTVSRTIRAEVSWNPVIIDGKIKGALQSGQDVKFSGNAISCGYNHRIDTPTGTGVSGRLILGGCAENLLANPPQWEWPSTTIAGIWSAGDCSPSGAANAFGAPALLSNASPFPAGPWDALGMTPAQFWAWVGPPIATMPVAPDGVYYLDNDATKQNASGSWQMVDGQGFLYCDGDLTLHDNWRGLVYIEGDMKLNGNAWILGAVIAKGKNKIQFNGGATILYSYDAIAQNMGNNVSWRKPSLISWKEL